MQSAIDFGKEFLTQYFNKRDAAATAAFLADDIIWITPNEIQHFKSARAIHDFLVSSVEDDPNAYNVDYAATFSVPNLDTANIIVFDVNLISKHKETSVNMRCTLGLHRKGVGYEMVYVGMSRRYERTDVEHIRGFADALPCGIMTVASAGKEIRLMYASAYLYERLGYDEATFYEKTDSHLFFMMPSEEQKRMESMVIEMNTLQKPKPVSMQVTFLSSDGKSQIPFQVSISVGYKEGDQTILYLVFHEITDLVTEFERQKKRQEKILLQQNASLQRGGTLEEKKVRKERSSVKGPLTQEEMEQQIEEIRRDAEKQIASIQIAANVDIEEAQKLANDEADAAEKLIRTQLEKAAKDKKTAVEKARRDLKQQYSTAWKQEKEKQAKKTQDLTDQLTAEKARADEQKEEIDLLKKQLKEITENKDQEVEEQVQARIREDEEQVSLKNAELDTAKIRLNEALEEAKAKEEELSSTIEEQKKEIENQKRSLQKKDVDFGMQNKEKEKSIERMESLLQGQMQSVRSIASAAGKEKRPEELRRDMNKIVGITEDLPTLIGDLSAISAVDPTQRKAHEEPFAVSDALNLARYVVRPKCREKGIIFSVESEPGMPNKVIGNKAGLELSFLSILENAVQNTLSGGQITLKARAESAVRGQAYYYFTVTDTGQGISESQLKILFDREESELSIARKVISSMGGSIQVHSKEKEGACFEIRVCLRLQR